MKWTALTFATLLGVSLQGCSLIPAYHRPEAPVDQAWPQGPSYKTSSVGAANSAKSIADLHWQQFFRDPAMRQLIGLSLTNNRDLRQAALNVNAYRALFRIQRSELLPTVGVDGEGAKQRLAGDLSIPGKTGTFGNYELNVGITSYELDVFGRIRSLNESALQTYLATEEAQHSVQVGLVASVASAYLTWRTDQDLLKIAQSTYDTYVHGLNVMESAHSAGTTSDLSVRQARTLVDSARAQTLVYTHQVAHDVNALTLLIGTRMPANLPDSGDWTQRMLASIPAGLPADILRQRPDVRAAERDLIAANANIGAARAAFYPSITLTANAGAASEKLSHLFEGGQGQWTFIPQINIPIFNGGRLKANLNYAEIQKDIRVAAYEKSIQTAFSEVADGLAAVGVFDEQVQAHEDLVHDNEAYLELAQNRFQHGVENFLPVLDAQRNLFSAREQLATNRLQQLESQVQLYRALGGGWDDTQLASAHPADSHLE
ncbi:efflux transporter outer membrane subunit [Pseudomonas sp. dw_358]|uniref:efflux transporter outer membrane subunit n=1 Tax=Pseudomonas sp. dw_358 TaxID=2720083 RepID=UPI001BD48FBF|nr:efflux transporter outer membrane subunit [Pseudomonas sp. dw_358]